eukprot:4525375-Ditylum_brightwellii.AAC.1
MDHYKSTIETMYHYKGCLLAADHPYMFQNLAEAEEFLCIKLVQYIQDWIVIWYPFFKKGIKDGQKQATTGVKPIPSYFNKKCATSRACLPPRFTSRYNGIHVMQNKSEGS